MAHGGGQLCRGTPLEEDVVVEVLGKHPAFIEACYLKVALFHTAVNVASFEEMSCESPMLAHTLAYTLRNILAASVMLYSTNIVRDAIMYALSVTSGRTTPDMASYCSRAGGEGEEVG